MTQLVNTFFELIKPTGWVLENGDDEYWSNEFGWTTLSQADVFSDDERATLNPPDVGAWMPLSKLHEQRIESIRNHPAGSKNREGAGLRLISDDDEQ
jgi:hypothetical protein